MSVITNDEPAASRSISSLISAANGAGNDWSPFCTLRQRPQSQKSATAARPSSVSSP